MLTRRFVALASAFITATSLVSFPPPSHCGAGEWRELHGRWTGVLDLHGIAGKRNVHTAIVSYWLVCVLQGLECFCELRVCC
jgi:hypothetical protein